MNKASLNYKQETKINMMPPTIVLTLGNITQKIRETFATLQGELLELLNLVYYFS